MIGCMTFYVAASQKCQLLDILCISGDMKCGTHLSLQARWSKDQWLSWIAVIFSQGLQRVYFFKQISKIGKTPARRNFLSSAEMLGSRFLSSVRGVPCPRPSQLCDEAQMCHAECGTPGLWWVAWIGAKWPMPLSSPVMTSPVLKKLCQGHRAWTLSWTRRLVWVSWSFPFHSTIGESWFYMIL